MPTYVISDLHVGAGPLDDCDSECEDTLVAFVEMLTKRANISPVELVLNGDTFDFVQAAPWRAAGFENTSVEGIQLCFTELQSCQKAKSIIDAHVRFFDALTRFLTAKNTRLTILPGNHDVDLFWPSVREIFSERIGQFAGLFWHLERHYRPPNAPWAWIEHGHQYDPINSFFQKNIDSLAERWSKQRPPIFVAKDGSLRLMACLGTRFMLRFLNELDYRFPFVDNIKPFSRFLSIFASSANQLRGGTVRAALSSLAFVRFMATEAITAPHNLLGLKSTTTDLRSELIALEKATAGEFSRSLCQAGFSLQGNSFDLLLATEDGAERVVDFALAHLDALDDLVVGDGMLSLEGGSGTLSLAGGFAVDETKELRNAASKLLQDPSITDVIMGHTHEGVNDPNYKNTGSWTRYWDFKIDEPTPSWREIVQKQASLPLSPRFALIDENAQQPVQLITF